MKTWTRTTSQEAPAGTLPEGAPPPLETLKMIRRLDWRFLLPEPELGRTAYVGPQESGLAEALRTFSDPFVPLDDGGADAESPPEPGDCDLAVVASRRMGDLRRGIQRLTPGGHLYWEVDRQPRILRWGDEGRRRSQGAGTRAGRLLQDPRRTLEAMGLEDVRVGCPFPRIQHPRTILSPDPAAVRYATSMRNGGTFGLGPFLALASRWNLLPRILPTLAVVGRRPGGPPSHGGIAAASLMGEREQEELLQRAPWILLTPRVAFFVVALLLNPDTGVPVSVVKSMGLPGDRRAARSLARESRGLRLAEAAPLPRPDSIPAVLGRSRRGATHQVALSAVPGRALTRREIRRRPEYWTGKAVSWLTDVHRATRKVGGEASARHEHLVDGSLERLATHLPGTAGCHALLDRSRGLTDRLRGMAIPSVLEHGDFCPSNLLATATGEVSVVDWEFANPDGFPGTDLFFLLASVAMARAGDPPPEGAVLAFRDAFRAPGGWARPWVAGYWRELGLPADAAQPLFVTTWTRLASRLLWRPDESLVRAGGSDLGRGLIQHRYFRFWAEALGFSEGAGDPRLQEDRPERDGEPYADLANAGRTP